MPKTDYRLTTWDEQDRNYIEISAAEFEELKSAKANVLETMFIEEKMDLVIETILNGKANSYTRVLARWCNSIIAIARRNRSAICFRDV